MSVRHSALLPLLLLAACNGTQASPQAASTEFDEERAWKDLIYLCEEIGQRRIGTPGAVKTRDYLQQEMGKLDGWAVEIEEFIAVPPEGARRSGEIAGANVLARLQGTEEGEIWIGSHYDTYDMPGFIGANDGASSTAVLLELARQLATDTPRTGMTIVLAWFDGEEKFPPLAWDNNTNSTFGSRHTVARLVEEERIRDVRALILLDLVGDKDLGLMVESNYVDQRIKRVLESAARARDDDKIFTAAQGVNDDHIHFHRERVPVVDLIDFRYGPNNRWWHTLEDTPENCSAESLGRVGRLILAALPEMQVEFAAGKR